MKTLNKYGILIFACVLCLGVFSPLTASRFKNIEKWEICKIFKKKYKKCLSEGLMYAGWDQALENARRRMLASGKSCSKKCIIWDFCNDQFSISCKQICECESLNYLDKSIKTSFKKSNIRNPIQKKINYVSPFLSFIPFWSNLYLNVPTIFYGLIFTGIDIVLVYQLTTTKAKTAKRKTQELYVGLGYFVINNLLDVLISSFATQRTKFYFTLNYFYARYEL